MHRFVLLALSLGTVVGAWWPAACAARETDQALAKRYFQLGAELYQRSDYEGALEQFKRSYRYSKKPELLFNIARCNESLGRYRAAIDAYRGYVAAKPDQKPRIEPRIENLERLLKRREERQPASRPATPPASAPATPASAPTSAPVAPTPAAPERPARGGGGLGVAGWVVGGIGAAMLITAGALGGVVLAKQSSLEQANRDGKEYSDVQNQERLAKHLQLSGIVLAAAGGAALITSAVLLFLHYRNKGRAERQTAWVAPVVGPSGCGVRAMLRF